MDTAHLAIGPDQCDRFVLKRTNRRNHGKDERRANHRALRRSRRGSSRVDSRRVIYLHWLYWMPGNKGSSLSLARGVCQCPDRQVCHLRPPGAAQGHGSLSSPYPPTFVQWLQQWPARVAHPALLGLHKEGKQQCSGTAGVQIPSPHISLTAPLPTRLCWKELPCPAAI